ncbi:hypothetical protein FGIG_09671 [Fasciola gigantica]|uniref:Uncharacterized protein n=1 Tax=Fasciola gigantica TaxID=46835 RepID=A0A504YJ36_FASGI|nr:hypothetical protein FGIG_09671 [Fasciola gigantica]
MLPASPMQTSSLLGSTGRHSMTDYPVFPGLRDNGTTSIPTVTSPQVYRGSTPPPPRRSVSLTSPFPSTALNSDTGSYVIVPGTTGPLSHYRTSPVCHLSKHDLVSTDSFGTSGHVLFTQSDKTCTDMSRAPICASAFSISSTSTSLPTGYSTLGANSIPPDFLGVDRNPSSSTGSRVPNNGTVEINQGDEVDAE